MTNLSERTDRLDAMLREGRIVRHSWSDGSDRACLLAALSPEAGEAQSASACPAEVMPPWLAHLTPWLDDATSEQAWPAIVARYASLARRWGVLDSAGWERARIAALLVIVTEARSHVVPEHAGVLAAIDGVLDWLRRGAPRDAADAVTRAADAERAAEAAEAAWAAAMAARRRSSLCVAPRFTVAAAAWAAAEAARAAAWAAADAAWAAAEAARSARAAASSDAAADRIAAGVLDGVEHEIERMEAADLRGAHLIDQGLRDLHRLVRVALTAAPDAERAGLVLGHTQVGRVTKLWKGNLSIFDGVSWHVLSEVMGMPGNAEKVCRRALDLRPTKLDDNTFVWTAARLVLRKQNCEFTFTFHRRES